MDLNWRVGAIVIIALLMNTVAMAEWQGEL
ncbi:MAG: hypothetical protein ACI9UQ_000600, partial [Candidatus Krumholzibacteriia bacterium]